MIVELSSCHIVHGLWLKGSRSRRVGASVSAVCLMWADPSPSWTALRIQNSKRVNSSEATKLTTICSEPHETLVVQERIHTNGPTLQQCRNAVAGFICLRSIPAGL